MTNMWTIPRAAALGLHAVVLLAANPGRSVSAREIASDLRVSEAHLSKVLQRLRKMGIVNSVPGPGGGFRLARSSGEIALLDVYEAIEGSLEPTTCLFDVPVCRGEKCILGGLLQALDQDARNYLAKAKLDQLAEVFQEAKCKS